MGDDYRRILLQPDQELHRCSVACEPDLRCLQIRCGIEISNDLDIETQPPQRRRRLDDEIRALGLAEPADERNQRLWPFPFPRYLAASECRQRRKIVLEWLDPRE